MALFDVPGWIVPAAPVSEPQKRKRPAHSAPDAPEKVHRAEVNMEKLMKKMKDTGRGTEDGQTRRKKAKRQAAHTVSGEVEKLREQKRKSDEEKESGGRKGRQAKKGEGKPPAVGADTRPSHAPPPKKNQERRVDRRPAAAASTVAPSTSSQKTSDIGLSTKLTVLQSGMKQSLDGARFRWINESLYKSDSAKAREMMREDPNVFIEYHKGFRHQVESWPSNPVSHYISSLSSYQPSTVIADLGCGDAALARALIPKGFTVLSYDLVSDGAFVAEADIFGRLPLPGSEEDLPENANGQGHGQVVNVVVFALSLMGTNWPNAIREAWRVLRAGGELKVAEVASRFSDVEEFKAFIGSFGFRLKSSDDSNTHFTLFEFRKIAQKPKSGKEWEKLLSRGDILKPSIPLLAVWTESSLCSACTAPAISSCPFLSRLLNSHEEIACHRASHITFRDLWDSGASSTSDTRLCSTRGTSARSTTETSFALPRSLNSRTRRDRRVKHLMSYYEINSARLSLIGHFSFGVRSIAISQPFYTAILSTFGVSLVYVDIKSNPKAVGHGYGDREPLNIFEDPDASLHGKGTHLAFNAPSRKAVDDFYAAALAIGGKGDGAPELMKNYHDNYDACFVYDPDEHKLETVFQQPEDKQG